MPLKKIGSHWFLTDDEVQSIRKQLDETREKGIYSPGKWFVSGLNRKPGVLGAALPDHMPKRVVLKDITLRTAEQTPGVILDPQQRLRLLRAVAGAGVTSFQVTSGLHRHPGEQLKQEIAFIKDLVPGAQVEIVGAANKENIDRMADLGANCASIQGPANFGITAFYGAGATAMTAWEGKDWRKLVNPPKILEELVEFKEVQALLLKNRRMLGDDEIRAVAVRIRQTA